MLPFLGTVMLATMIGGVGGNVAQSGLLFTADKLKPDWSKVNPLKGFQRIFGPDGLVQFLKTFLKLLAVGLICWLVLKPHVRELENMIQQMVAVRTGPLLHLNDLPSPVQNHLYARRGPGMAMSAAAGAGMFQSSFAVAAGTAAGPAIDPRFLDLFAVLNYSFVMRN
jgi:hypothetical protein